MKKTLLWLDDIRDPTDEMWINHIAKNICNPLDYNIEWVKDYTEFAVYITNNHMPNLISFDHDLADEHYTPERYWNNYDESKKYQDAQDYKEKTGLDCAKFLIDHCIDNYKGKLPQCYVHSYNPVGADNIRNLLNNFKENMRLTVKTDCTLSDLVESVGSKVNEKFYYLPFWFEKIEDGSFIMHHMDALPNELKVNIKKLRM